MAILAEFGPLEQMSVDEAYLDLTAVPNPESIAAQIKKAVIESTALPCSVGLATTKLVAKVASDHDKPDGYTIVTPGSEAAFLGPKPVRALWGIGPRTAESLAAINIHTCADLAGARPELLHSQVGRQASDLIDRARGIDPRPVQTDRGPAKSISQEWTFAQDVNDRGAASETTARDVPDHCAFPAQQGAHGSYSRGQVSLGRFHHLHPAKITERGCRQR